MQVMLQQTKQQQEQMQITLMQQQQSQIIIKLLEKQIEVMVWFCIVKDECSFQQFQTYVSWFVLYTCFYFIVRFFMLYQLHVQTLSLEWLNAWASWSGLAVSPQAVQKKLSHRSPKPID